jgi:hypothetical protein
VKTLKIFLGMLVGMSCALLQANVDLILFSCNRPLQLYASLETLKKQTKNLATTFVLYRVDSKAYDDAYNELIKDFSDVVFVKQGNNPRQDFRPLLMKCFDATSSPYIVFSVDDCVITEPFDFNDCVEALEKTEAYAFYLRLGKNLTHNSFDYNSFKVPPLIQVADHAYQFIFDQGNGDWNYPHSLVMTIFKKVDARDFCAHNGYSSPNTMEGNWAGVSPKNRLGLCFEKSVATMIPLNLVQTDWHNPFFNYCSTEGLLKKWQEGLKMDVSPLYGLAYTVNNVDVKPTFIKRNGDAS